MLVLSTVYDPHSKCSLSVVQGLFRLLCTSCSCEGCLRKELKVLMCGGDRADCLVPCKAERCANERSRVRVREECKCHHFCKCGRMAGQSNLDGNKDRAKGFRLYGSPNYEGGGECDNMLQCYTDTLPTNNFIF